jgi:hypothetical protein
MSRKLLAALATFLAAAGLLLVGPAASASQGSVPQVITSYSTDPNGLIFQLNDLFGVGKSGQGIDFDDTTKAGSISRVFVWTDDFLAGQKTDQPMRRLNEWVAPISVRDSTIGFAIISIDDQTSKPQLANFLTGAAVAEKFGALPTDAYLVNDSARSAWFSVLTSTVTAIDAGKSGVTSPIQLTTFQAQIAHVVPKTSSPVADSGFAVGGLVLLIVALAIASIIFGPTVLQRRRAAKAADAKAVAAKPAP